TELSSQLRPAVALGEALRGLPRRGGPPGETCETAGVVQQEHMRLAAVQLRDRHRRGLDDDPVELVQRRAGEMGREDADDVAVRGDRHPPPAVTPSDPLDLLDHPTE